MAELILPPGFVLPGMSTALSPFDTMHDGSDDRYLAVGVSALEVIDAAFAGAPPPSRILDLPCGFGRVTRTLRARFAEAAITVCDLDRAGVDFAAAAFGARGAYSTADFRDLHLGQTFDLIWVGSLLTHLPEHQTRQFLDFAERHLGPDGRLVVTSHGTYVAERLRSSTYGLSEQAACGLLCQYLADGYGYRGYSGDPAYGISLVARAWYERLLEGSGLRLQSYVEQGWDRHQDVLVIGRAPASGTTMFERADVPRPLPAAEQDARDLAGAAGFDEVFYQRRFADVAAAVDAKAFGSGWEHYIEYGRREGRPPCDPATHYAVRSRSGAGEAGETVLPKTIRCRSLEAFRAIEALPAMSGAAMAAFEQGIIGAPTTTYLSPDIFTVPGYCLVCRKEVAFLVAYEHCFLAPDGQRTPNWREHLRCPSCRLNNRMRAAAGFLLAMSKPDDAIYLTERVTPLFEVLSKHRRNLTGSEYLRDGTRAGGRNAQGVQHEDVSRLTFAAGSFDMIGSFEVLEHVPDYGRALAEFHRCLRPGGTLLLTVPFLLWSETTLVRATVDASGEITHLLPAEMHGDPLSDAGALCFYHFSWDFLVRMEQAGFVDVGILLFWEPRYGNIGGHQFIITARKPPHTGPFVPPPRPGAFGSVLARSLRKLRRAMPLR